MSREREALLNVIGIMRGVHAARTWPNPDRAAGYDMAINHLTGWTDIHHPAKPVKHAWDWDKRGYTATCRNCELVQDYRTPPGGTRQVGVWVFPDGRVERQSSGRTPPCEATS